MKDTPLLLNWSWVKSGDGRKPVTGELLIDQDTSDGPVLVCLELTAEQVTAMLSGSVVRVTGQVAEGLGSDPVQEVKDPMLAVKATASMASDPRRTATFQVRAGWQLVSEAWNRRSAAVSWANGQTPDNAIVEGVDDRGRLAYAVAVKREG